MRENRKENERKQKEKNLESSYVYFAISVKMHCKIEIEKGIYIDKSYELVYFLFIIISYRYVGNTNAKRQIIY